MIANLKFLIVFFHIVGHMWDAIHLYIANNLDWMEQWIERCTEYYGTLTWEGVCKMIKTMHRNREEYHELTQREIDFACSLKNKKVSIFTLLIFFFVSHCIEIFLSFMSSYIFIYRVGHDAANTSQCYVVQWL